MSLSLICHYSVVKYWLVYNFTNALIYTGSCIFLELQVQMSCNLIKLFMYNNFVTKINKIFTFYILAITENSKNDLVFSNNNCHLVSCFETWYWFNLHWNMDWKLFSDRKGLLKNGVQRTTWPKKMEHQSFFGVMLWACNISEMQVWGTLRVFQQPSHTDYTNNKIAIFLCWHFKSGPTFTWPALQNTWSVFYGTLFLCQKNLRCKNNTKIIVGFTCSVIKICITFFPIFVCSFLNKRNSKISGWMTIPKIEKRLNTCNIHRTYSSLVCLIQLIGLQVHLYSLPYS